MDMGGYKEFDDAFPDGIFIAPKNPKDPKVKIRDLYDYCKKHGIEPSDLSAKEMKQFLEYD